MAAPVAAGRRALTRARERWPFLDHAVRTQQHYSRVNGSGQAGAVTYFAFLSFFPIMALAFFVVGYVARVYPQAQDNLVKAIEQVLPHIVGNDPGEIHLSAIESSAGAVGLIGVVTLLYTGLGWLSEMRAALEVVFELPRSEYPSLLVGKLRDLVTLVLIGSILLVSVAVTGAVAGFTSKLLDLLDLGPGLSWLIHALGPLVGLAANVVLLMAMFRLLARPPTPSRSLWQGALMGAVAFEILKEASSYLLASTRQQPAFQAFGIALILLVWINYFSRVVMYAASWAHTSPASRAARDAVRRPLSPDTLALRARVAATRAGGAGVPVPADTSGSAGGRTDGRSVDPRLAFGAGAAAALGLVAVLRHRRH